MVVSAVAPATAVAEQSSTGKQISHKVELLRQEMAKADHGKGVQAYIIPTEDPHMVMKQPLHASLITSFPSEAYVPLHFNPVLLPWSRLKGAFDCTIQTC